MWQVRATLFGIETTEWNVCPVIEVAREWIGFGNHHLHVVWKN